MGKTTYRYRPMKSVLGEFQELKKQEIYFASIEELNDPMEGVIVPFYRGTNVHWIYFLKFYFMEVFNRYTDRYYSGIYISKEHFNTSINQCLAASAIQQFVQEAAKSEVHYTAVSVNRLFQYIIHPYIYYYIAGDIEALARKENGREFEIQKNRAEELLNNIAKITFHAFLRPQDTSDPELLEECYKKIGKDWTDFAFEKQFMPCISEELFAWPKEIIDYFIHCLFPRCRIASFSGRKNNASMWGHYASSQNGVCLEFDVAEDKDKRFLKLEGDFPSPIILKKVRYVKQLQNLEAAFNILGYINSLYNEKEANVGLTNAEDAYLQKFCDWKYEEEERMIIPDCGKERAKIRYDFSILKSITFGVNTSYADRYEIINIIRSKCEEYKRERFDFYSFDPYDEEWTEKPFFQYRA